MRRKPSASGALLVAVSFNLVTQSARAADPTTADCLGASEAALKFGSELKLRAERAQLLVCAASSCPADIRKECSARIEEVNAHIPTIIFQAKDGGGRDISAVKVTMDGEVIAERLQGAVLSIDPGSHMFTFETAGQPIVSERLLIQEAVKDRVEHVVLGGVPSGLEATQLPAAGPAPSTADRGATSSGSGLGTQKIVAIATAGAGVVGLGLGTAFGIMALAKKSDAQRVCANICANQHDADLWSDATSAGTVSTVALILGGVALAGAATIWFTAPPPDVPGSPTTQVGLGLGTIQLKAAW